MLQQAESGPVSTMSTEAAPSAQAQHDNGMQEVDDEELLAVMSRKVFRVCR